MSDEPVYEEIEMGSGVTWEETQAKLNNNFQKSKESLGSKVGEEVGKSLYPDVDADKLAGIESRANNYSLPTDVVQDDNYNHTDNNFSDGNKSKLDGLESSKFLGEFTSLEQLEAAYPSPVVGSYANVDSGSGGDVERYLWDSDDSKYVKQQGESTAETPASVKTKLLLNPDTHNFGDAEKALNDTISGKVAGEVGKSLYPDVDATKLAGIEAGANNYLLPTDVVIDEDYNHTDNNFSDASKDKVGNTPDNTNEVLSKKADLVEGKIPASQIPPITAEANTPLVATTGLLNPSALSLDTLKALSFTVPLHTGNGTSQTIATGINSVDFTESGNGSGFWLDRTVNQVKDDAGVVQASGTASWGGAKGVSKVHIKARDGVINNNIYDGLRGTNRVVYTDLTNGEALNSDALTEFTPNGFTLGSNSQVNLSSINYVDYQTLYTIVKWGTTNQGKFYVEAYNPTTEEGMIYYIGSGITSHEIPFSVGVELGYADFKRLDVTANWKTYSGDTASFFNLNLTNAKTATTQSWKEVTSTYISIGTPADLNSANGEYICYYKCKTDQRFIGTYEGTGVVGSKVTLTDYNGNPKKPSRVITKNIDDVSDFMMWDVKRGNNFWLSLNDSATENVSADQGKLQIDSDGFTVGSTNNTTSSNNNKLGDTYLYIVEVDTNKDDGGAYADYPTTGVANVNGGFFNFTDGVTEKGFNTTSKTVTKSFDPVGVSDGWKYPSENEDGTHVWYGDKPSTVFKETGIAFNVLDGKWYENNVVMSPVPSFLTKPLLVADEKVQKIGTDTVAVNVQPKSSFPEGAEIATSLLLETLPTADPFLKGCVWVDGDNLKVSGG